jgi:hypothetical protein
MRHTREAYDAARAAFEAVPGGQVTESLHRPDDGLEPYWYLQLEVRRPHRRAPSTVAALARLVLAHDAYMTGSARADHYVGWLAVSRYATPAEVEAEGIRRYERRQEQERDAIDAAREGL